MSVTITFKATESERDAITWLIENGKAKSGGALLRKLLYEYSVQFSFMPSAILSGMKYSIGSKYSYWRRNGLGSRPMFAAELPPEPAPEPLPVIESPEVLPEPAAKPIAKKRKAPSHQKPHTGRRVKGKVRK